MEKHFITGNELRQIGSTLKRDGIYHIAGTHSISVPSSKQKYTDRAAVKNWPDEDGQYRLMTPGEAARNELKRAFPDLKRVGWNKHHISLFDKRVPLHYSGPATGDMMYIDLDGAYHQIYRRLWLDTPWPCGYYGRYPMKNVADGLKEWKAARNAVIGICRSRSVVGIKGSKRYNLSVKNDYLSPKLWASVQDLLHLVAGVALSCGAIYINTDGYVFPDSQADNPIWFIEWLTKMDFAFSIRDTGPGEILGWNNYRINRAETKAHKLKLKPYSKEFSNVETKSKRWSQYWRKLGLIVRS